MQKEVLPVDAGMNALWAALAFEGCSVVFLSENARR